MRECVMALPNRGVKIEDRGALRRREEVMLRWRDIFEGVQTRLFDKEFDGYSAWSIGRLKFLAAMRLLVPRTSEERGGFLNRGEGEDVSEGGNEGGIENSREMFSGQF